MAEWVVVCPILGVFDIDTGYEGGGAPVAVVEANSGQKSAEFYIKIYFGVGKVAAL